MHRVLYMKILFQILIIMIIGTASSAEINGYDKLANSKEVSVVSEEVKWPEKSYTGHRKKIVFSNFSFSVPENFDSILMAENTPGFIFDYNGKQIYIELINSDNFKDKYKADINSTNLKVYDFPRILFEGTLENSDGKSYANEFMNFLFKYKKMYFGRTNKAFMSLKGTLSAYYISESLPGWGPYAIITDKRYPDKLLNIQFLNKADIESLREIISSIGD